MTPALEALGRRAVACKGWRWLPGMLAWEAGRDVRLVGDSDVRRVQGVGMPLLMACPAYEPDAFVCGLLPDLSDPATLGAVLALVREAWGPVFQVSPLVNKHGATRWTWYANDIAEDHPEHEGGLYMSEAEALLRALECAP